MRLHVPDGFVLFVALVALVLAVPSICFGKEKVYIDSISGNDANSGLDKDHAVLTWARAIQLGILEADTGVRIVNGDTPPLEVIQSVMLKKKDLARWRVTQEIIPGHGEMPVEVNYSSPDAGFAISTVIDWTVLRMPNGELAEDIKTRTVRITTE